MARKPLIPAVAYLRKSTKGKKSDGKERQEKSIPGQRGEIEKYAKANGFKIVREYVDEGISGWKRGDDRPQFKRMIREAEDRGDVQAVLCDDLDRFSRAEVMEVFSDLTSLAAAGVRKLACVNQGEYQLGDNDIGRILKLLVDVHGSNEFSRKLGRRLSISRCNAAKKGKRSGGKSPFGYKNDGAGSLILDQDESPIVVKMFEDFLSGARSLRSIASDLNEQGLPSPRGLKWSGAAVRFMLTNRAYRGDFVYNLKKSGQFYFVDENQEVKPSAERQHPSWYLSDAGAFIKEGAHTPLVPVEVFDKVQEKLKTNKKRKGRNRTDGYALTGVLVCGHCGGPMWGVQRRGVRQYQCSSNNRKGASVCPAYTVREDEILPFVLARLKKEVGLAKMVALQPKPRKPFEQVPGHLDQLRRRHETVSSEIEAGSRNLLLASNSEVYKMLEVQMSMLFSERKTLEDQIAAASVPCDQESMVRYVQEFVAWLKSVEDRLQKVWHCPENEKQPRVEMIKRGKASVSLKCSHVVLETAVLRQLLQELGTRVELFFDSQQWGKRTVYPLASDERCRFKMGQFEGPLPVSPKWKGMSSSVD